MLSGCLTHQIAGGKIEFCSVLLCYCYIAMVTVMLPEVFASLL